MARRALAARGDYGRRHCARRRGAGDSPLRVLVNKSHWDAANPLPRRLASSVLDAAKLQTSAAVPSRSWLYRSLGQFPESGSAVLGKLSAGSACGRPACT